MDYELEYGTAAIEVHKDDVKNGMKIVLIDDLIATGGTLEAAAKLFESLGTEIVKVVCLLELKGLKGREKLSKYNVGTVIAYEGN